VGLRKGLVKSNSHKYIALIDLGKEESPYKPEEFLSGLILAFAHVFSHKERQHFAAVILAAI